MRPAFLDDGTHPSITLTSEGLAPAWIKRVAPTGPLALPDWNMWYMSSADGGTIPYLFLAKHAGSLV